MIFDGFIFTMKNEKKQYKDFGKKIYFIQRDGKMVKKFGMFRTKDFARQTIKQRTGWEQEEYSIGTKITGKKI